MTATTQPGITLEEHSLDSQIEMLKCVMGIRGLGCGISYDNAILASLIRLREIEGKLREPTREMLEAGYPPDNEEAQSWGVREVFTAMSALMLRGKP